MKWFILDASRLQSADNKKQTINLLVELSRSLIEKVSKQKKLMLKPMRPISLLIDLQDSQCISIIIKKKVKTKPVSFTASS